MKPFHVYLYGPDRGPIETSFESAAARLQSLNQLYFEPDGSFVLTRDQGADQVFGMVYDTIDRLQYVELRGQCTLAIWRELMVAIVGRQESDLAVLVLPERQLQTLQNFENSLISG